MTTQFVAWYMATKEQRAEIVRYFLLVENWSYDRLAAYLGVSRNVIAGVCNRNGIRISSRTPKKIQVHPLDKVEVIPAFLPKRDNIVEFKPPAQPESREEAASDMVKRLKATRIASAQTATVMVLANKREDKEKGVTAPNPRHTGHAWEPLPDLVPVRLMDLTSHDCRWPVTEQHGLFCGAQAVEGKSYCAAHAAHAYLPTKPIVFKKKERRFG